MDADGQNMSLPKFDIYQRTEATNCFKSHKNSFFFKNKFRLMSGLKFTLSNITPFLPDNLSELKQIIFRPESIT